MQEALGSFQTLWAQAQGLTLARDQTLFLRGDTPLALYWLEAGRLRLRRCSADGSETTMQTVLPGQTFAEASLFSQSYHCDCVAEQASQLRLLPRTQLLARLQSDAGFALAITQQLAMQLRQARLQTELSHIRSAPERVIAALRLQSDETGHVVLAGSWKDFAGHLGLTHEAVYRALARLEAEGKIERDKRSLRLLVSKD